MLRKASTTTAKTTKATISKKTEVAVTKPSETETETAEYDPKLDDVYRQLNERSHVLLRPDIFIGSTAVHPCSRWVVDSDSTSVSEGSDSEKEEKGAMEKKGVKMVYREIPYIAGLGKIFDEAITNARDHALRMTFSQRADKRPVTYIHADVCQETGWISIQNDGSGIDIAKHSELHVYYPELIFGHFRSSTNYDEDRVFNTGAGKNGYGIKLTLIWSKEAVLETVDSGRGLKYTQRFLNNLETIEEPVITKVRVGTKPYTMIKFLPDYVRFGLKDGKISAEMYALLHKRVLDMAGVSGPGLGLGEGAVISSVKGVGAEKGKGLTVQWKGEPVSIKNFSQYINLYIGSPKEGPEGVRVYEAPHPRWEYAVALSPSENFMHVSFVNGISTANGGSHVDYIINQLTSKLVKLIEQKKKVKVSSASLKQQLVLFLRCDVEEPSFDNQSKDRLVMPVDKFGSSCVVSTAFVENVYKMGVADFAMKMTNMREEKKTDGKKKKTILGIPKYSPAEYAGTKRSNEAVLILTEGDSAKASVNSGISAEDRKRIGVFPLKGKLMNVRDELATKIAKNEEISNLKRILGLEQGKKYKTIEDVHANLRYSKVLILCDQDHDGSHIKGLLVNLFQSEWPDLYRIPGFLAFMNTPILTATKGAVKKLFYNNGEYEQWKASLVASSGGVGDGGLHLWKIKYFKGLGTSTSAEFRDYFANKKIVDFVYNGEKSDDTVDLVFRKKRADDRKAWMGGYDRNLYLDTSKPKVAYEEFFNNEMIHFSVYSCERALPNIVDGLKSSQRKILYCAFKRNLVGELKVAQFAGYVSEHACYHHGETSLGGAIIGMAQTFVGSNNINLLMPCGQFGTRNLGGNEAASVRYIFTRLNPITRFLFPKEDDAVLKYLDDDGTQIEPEYYVPIIPMVLVNGCEGIGTGYSCSVPAFNPADLIKALRERILACGGDVETRDWLPYYEGFSGRIDAIGKGKFLTRGIYRRIEDDAVFISELPVGTWTGYLYYKKFLEELVMGKVDDKGKQISPPVIKEYQMTESEVKVMITVRFLSSEQLDELERTTYANGVNGVEKLLALTTTYGTQNMMLFDTECKLKNYETVDTIIDEFYGVRYETYRKRKASLIRAMQGALKKMANKARFIQEIVAGRIDLRKHQNDGEVDAILEAMKFDRMMSDGSEVEGEEEEGGKGGNYKYLTEMKLNTLTKERAEKLMRERDEAEAQLRILEATTLETMWLRELDALETKYTEDRAWRIQLQNPDGGVSKNSKTSSFVTSSSDKKRALRKS
jgi:DNA topoisomerase-2